VVLLVGFIDLYYSESHSLLRRHHTLLSRSRTTQSFQLFPAKTRVTVPPNKQKVSEQRPRQKLGREVAHAVGGDDDLVKFEEQRGTVRRVLSETISADFKRAGKKSAALTAFRALSLEIQNIHSKRFAA